MEIHDALHIIRTLARGVNPADGTPIPKDSPHNQPDVIRALFTVAENFPKRKKPVAERQRENVERGLPRNSGLPWTDDGRQAVADEFGAGKSIETIATAQERSQLSIVAELKRQGVISAEEAAKLGLVQSMAN